MSEHLAYLNHIVDLGTSVEDCRLEFKGHFTANGWQVLADEPVNAGTGAFVVIPPASQQIGNSMGRDVLRVSITGTELRFHTGYQLHDTYRGITDFQAAMPWYAVAPAILLGGRKIVGASTNAGYEYELGRNNMLAALNADAEFTANYTAEAVSRNGSFYIRVQAKPGVTPPTLAASDWMSEVKIVPQVNAGSMMFPPHTWNALSIDLANGFAYYFSLYERTVVLATETIAAYSGPLFASWADHDAALRGCPPGCFPVELLGGRLSGTPDDQVSIGAGHGQVSVNFGWFAHAYGHRYNPSQFVTPATAPAEYASSSAPTNPRAPTNLVFWYSGAQYYTSLASPTQALAGFGPSGNRNMTPFASVSLATADLWGAEGQAPILNSTTALPGYSFPDIQLAARQAPAQVKLALAGRNDLLLTLSQPATAADNTLTLTDASKLPTAGTLVLSTDEVVTYSGKAGNTLTGVTRGKFGSTPAAQATGSVVRLGGWYLRFNAAMIYCGVLKPGSVA